MGKRKKVADFVGIRSTYTEYRYGNGRDVGLPGRIPKARLKGPRRKDLVDATAEMLGHWHSSPFEYEGSARAGIRSALCLEWGDWRLADAEADGVVAKALRANAAERPSWDDGQRGYVDRGDFCIQCGGAMPDELVAGRRNSRFCCEACAKAYISAQNEGVYRDQTAAVSEFYNIVARKNLAPKTCIRCGEAYTPHRVAYGRQKYCSFECYSETINSQPIVKCVTCGKEFSSQRKRGQVQITCSRPCWQEYAKKIEKPHICVICGAVYSTNRNKSACCSHNCACFVSDWRLGKRVPKKLSNRLFDFMFTAPIALSRTSRTPSMFLTAGLFDSLFREAA